MGRRIDEVNEIETLKEKAAKWDAFCKLIDSIPDYQRWLKEQQERGR